MLICLFESKQFQNDYTENRIIRINKTNAFLDKNKEEISLL